MHSAKVKWILRYMFILLLMLMMVFSLPVFQKISLCSVAESAAADQTIIYLFWGKECANCEEIKPFLAEMETKYPGIPVKDYEVFGNKENKELLLNMLKEHEADFAGVPVIFIGDRIFQNAGKIGKVDLEAAISRTLPPVVTVDLPLLGTREADNLSLPLVTVLLAAVDSFNPCAFFVLFSFLGLLIQLRSRKKMLLLGSIFVFISGLLYFLFLAAWLNLFLVFEQIKAITLLAGIVAIFIGVINIKDFFFFKKGISLTIPDQAKPKLFDRMRKLLRTTSFSSIAFGAVILAVAANFYELLCTAGFPMVFTRILTLNNLPTFTYYLYLLLYTLVYVLPLIGIVLILTITLGKRNISEWQGRVLKFVSGAIMFSLGLILIINPLILSNLKFSLSIFLGTIGGASLIALCLKKYFR